MALDIKIYHRHLNLRLSSFLSLWGSAIFHHFNSINGLLRWSGSILTDRSNNRRPLVFIIDKDWCIWHPIPLKILCSQVFYNKLTYTHNVPGGSSIKPSEVTYRYENNKYQVSLIYKQNWVSLIKPFHKMLK